MRVLYCVGSLETGGLERFVTRIALRARQGGEFEPAVCCLYQRTGIFLEQLERAGVEVYAAPRGWERRARPWWEFMHLVRRVAPTVVHSQSNFSLLQQFAAVRVAGRCVFCVTERSCYRLHGFARLRRLAQFHSLRPLGLHYSANSEAVAAHLARQVGVPVGSIPVLPNGVEIIPPDATVRARVRSELGWQEDEVGIVYVGRLMLEKGQVEFLRALARLRAAGLPVKACLVGDGPMRDELRRLVDELVLPDAVWFAGVVEDVESYLQAADMVALFSSREGMPNAVLEAMAAGKAVVATAVGAIPQMLEDGRVGVVVGERTVEAIAAGLRRLAEDAALRERLGRAARERVGHLYGIETSLQTLIRHYREVT